MTFTGWVQYAGTELVNDARALAYAAAAGVHLDEQLATEAPDLQVALGHEQYSTPQDDRAPWWDAAVPASAAVLGYVGLDVQGLDRAPGGREVTDRVGADGANLGVYRRSQREVLVRTAVFAVGSAALSYGITWLAAALRGAVCGVDGQDELCVFATAPVCPDVPVEPDAPVVSRVNLVQNPSQESGAWWQWTTDLDPDDAGTLAPPPAYSQWWAYSGIGSLQLTTHGDQGARAISIEGGLAVEPATADVVSVWALPRDAGALTRLRVRQYSVGETRAGHATDWELTTVGAARRLVLAFTTGADVDAIDLVVEVQAGTPAGQRHHFDAFLLEEDAGGGAAGEYFDGDSEGAQWYRPDAAPAEAHAPGSLSRTVPPDERPPAPPSGCGDAEHRTLLGVGLLSGPAVQSTYTAGADCNGVDVWVAEVEFTLVAGRPYLHRLPVDIAVDAAFAPVASLVELPDPADCPQPVDCSADPLLAALPTPPAPPVPVDPAVCTYRPFPLRQTWTVPAALLPEAPDKVPVVQVYAGSQPMRCLSVRFYVAPAGECTAATADPCAACAEINLPYLPAGATLTLDGRTERALITCAPTPDQGVGATAEPVLYGPAGTPMDWPTFTCADALCVEVAMSDLNVARADATVSVAMVGREDAL